MSPRHNTVLAALLVLVVLVVLALFPASLVSTDRLALAAGSPPLPSSLEEEVLVRRVRWPVLLREKREGACEALIPSMIQVTEDGGPPLPVEEIDRRRMPTIHAILIDISGSRLPQIGATREAALAYIEEIREDDPVMVALFGESLSLVLPLTRDRKLAAETIGRPGALRAMGFTALWDSLFDLVRYLEDRPERKVIILLSDGCENRSMMSQLTGGHPAPLEAAVERSENLAVFAIGIDLPSRCRGDNRETDPRDLFRALAEGTGGGYHSLRYRSKEGMFSTHLARVFDEIRGRLQREGSILYRPQPFGEGPRDDPDRAARRLRRVRVRLGSAADGTPPPPGCTVLSAGPRSRTEGAPAPGTPPLSLLPLDTEQAPVPSPVALPPAELWQQACGAAWERDAVEEGGGPRCPADPDSWLLLQEKRIEGRIVDVEAERGFLYEPAAKEGEREGEREGEKGGGRRGGGYRQSADRQARLGVRELRLPVPPYRRLREEILAPELALLWLLHSGEAPTFLHGSTFLQSRRYLGQALFAYPGYREFASEKARELHREESAEILALVEADRGPLEAGEREDLGEILEERSRIVRPREPQRFLAEWIEDLTAESLSARVEGRVANIFLSRPGVPSRPELLRQAREWAEVVEAGWHLLGEWFPPATRARVVTPLVPVYDAGRDTVGFFRVILPYPEMDMGPLYQAPGAVPPAPLGLRTVRWLLDRPRLEEALPGELRLGWIAGLSFGGYERRKQVDAACRAARHDPRFRAPCEALSSARAAVRLGFEPAGSSGTAFTLTAFFAGTGREGGALEPLCLALESAKKAGAGARALSRLVGDDLAEGGFLCSPSR